MDQNFNQLYKKIQQELDYENDENPKIQNKEQKGLGMVEDLQNWAQKNKIAAGVIAVVTLGLIYYVAVYIFGIGMKKVTELTTATNFAQIEQNKYFMKLDNSYTTETVAILIYVKVLQQHRDEIKTNAKKAATEMTEAQHKQKADDYFEEAAKYFKLEDNTTFKDKISDIYTKFEALYLAQNANFKNEAFKAYNRPRNNYSVYNAQKRNEMLKSLRVKTLRRENNTPYQKPYQSTKRELIQRREYNNVFSGSDGTNILREEEDEEFTNYLRNQKENLSKMQQSGYQQDKKGVLKSKNEIEEFFEKEKMQVRQNPYLSEHQKKIKLQTIEHLRQMEKYQPIESAIQQNKMNKLTEQKRNNQQITYENFNVPLYTNQQLKNVLKKPQLNTNGYKMRNTFNNEGFQRFG